MNEETVTADEATGGAPPSRAETPPLSASDMIFLGVKLLLGLALLGGLVALLAHVLRDEVSSIATTLVTRLGLLGIAAGVFAADSVNVPVPVQAYQLAVVAKGGPQAPALVVMVVASILGGHLGYFLGGRLAHRRWVRRILLRLVRGREHLWERYGYRALLVAAVIPFPYSGLCWFSGLKGVPYRRFVWLMVLRIPKVLLYYAMIRAGWA